MPGSERANDSDVAHLLAEHFEELTIDDVFRRGLQERTRQAIAGHRRGVNWSRALGAAGVAVVLLLGVFAYWYATLPTVTNDLRAVARRPGQIDKHETQQAKSPPTPPAPSQARRGTAGPMKTPPGVGLPSPAPYRDSDAPDHGLSAKVPGGARRVPGTAGTPSTSPSSPGNREPLLAVVAAKSPVTNSLGRAIAAGDRLENDDSIRTGKGGRITLVTRRGSQLEVDSNSEITLHVAGTMRLVRGRVYCSNRNHEISTIDTPAGRVELLGTALDTAVLARDQVAVTVVEGRVELVNDRGRAVVDAGTRSVLVAGMPPQEGTRVNTFAETAWCDRIGDVESDFGEIAYTVEREKHLVTEVWVMNADGSNRRRVRSYVGQVLGLGPWMPAERWLLAETNSVGFKLPDMRQRRALSSPSEEILRKQKWFLNSATGQDVPMQIPTPYVPRQFSFSPDGRWIAFAAEEHYDPHNWTRIRHGVYLYDLRTGDVNRLVEGFSVSTPSWAPNNDQLVVTVGDYLTESLNQRLLLVDAKTLETTDLGVEGYMPTVSPDGTRMAYCRESSAPGATAISASKGSGVRLCVLDLRTGTAKSLTPEADVAMNPRWSPDGYRILFYYRPGTDNGLYITNADGSDRRPVCLNDTIKDRRIAFTVGASPCFGWTSSGKAVYVASDEGVLLFAADGSDQKANLSKGGAGSVLSPDEVSQTDAAVADLHEAVFQYALGTVRTFEGRVEESTAAFQAAATIFSELVWRYPLAGFSSADVLRYADKAQHMADRTHEQVLADACWDRMRYLRGTLSNWGQDRAVPLDLQTLEAWILENQHSDQTRVSWLEGSDLEHVRMAFTCPGGAQRPPADYVYFPPTNGVLPEMGQLMVVCSNHRDHIIRWWNCDAYGHGYAPRPMIFPWRAPFSY